MSHPDPSALSDSPPMSSNQQGIPLDFQDIVDDLRTQISNLNYENTLLRLTVKQMQQ